LADIPEMVDAFEFLVKKQLQQANLEKYQRISKATNEFQKRQQ
jgi:hypothetical protein